MANDTALITAAGTTIYIGGGSSTQTTYSGSGTPWTVQTTTPYEIALEGQWTPQVQPIDARTGTITIPLQMRGTTHDNCVTLKQTLAKELNTAGFSLPCTLAVDPDGGTGVAYYEIMSGTIQEDPRFINDEAGLPSPKLLRATLTLTVSARSTIRVSTNGEVVLSAVAFTNTGTGSPDNIVPYDTAASGELLSTKGGQPLNLAINFSADAQRVFLATVFSRVYYESNTSLITSSTTGAETSVDNSRDFATVTAVLGVKVRIIGRIASPSSNLEVQFKVKAIGGTVMYASPWVAPGAVNTLVDFGRAAIDVIRINGRSGVQLVEYTIGYRSTTGGATTGTLDYVETLFYYEFAIVTGETIPAAGSYLAVRQFYDLLGVPATPFVAPRALVTGATAPTGGVQSVPTVRGTLPRCHAGCSLYLAWHDATTGTHTTTRTATASGWNAPQWTSFRGGD